jgi:hypothetical protein
MWPPEMSATTTLSGHSQQGSRKCAILVRVTRSELVARLCTERQSVISVMVASKPVTVIKKSLEFHS